MQEKGATELTKGVLGAEDVEKAEGRPAPFKKKDASNGAATDEAAGAADAAAAAAPAKKKKKKKKAAATGASAVAAKTDEATGASDIEFLPPILCNLERNNRMLELCSISR